MSISFFNNARDVRITGGSFNIVSGNNNVQTFDHSRHTTNFDSFNTKTTTIRDSYNDNSQRGFGNSRLTAPNDRSIRDRTPSPQSYGGHSPRDSYPPQMSPPAQQHPPPWHSPSQGHSPYGYAGSPPWPSPGQMYNQPQYPNYPRYGQPQSEYYGSVPPHSQPNNGDNDDDNLDSDDESEEEAPLNQGQPPSQSSAQSPSASGFASTSTAAPHPKLASKKAKKPTKQTPPSFSNPSGNSQFQVSDAQVHSMSPQMEQDFSRLMHRTQEEVASSDEEEGSDEGREQITDRMANMDIDEPAIASPPLSRVKSNPGLGGLSPPSAGPLRPHSAAQFPTGKVPQYPVNTLPHPALGQYAHGYQQWGPPPGHAYPAQGYYPPGPGPPNHQYGHPLPDQVNAHGGSYTTTMNSGNHYTTNVIDSYNDNSTTENIRRSGKKKSKRNN